MGLPEMCGAGETMVGTRGVQLARHLPEDRMPWYAYIAHFFGGAAFVNAIPHFVNGVPRNRDLPEVVTGSDA